MFVIAEIACSHNGKFSQLKRLVHEASLSGADAVQFQIWSLKYMMSPKNKLFKKLKKIEFSQNDWIKIIRYTKQKFPKLKIFCCFYEHTSFALIQKIKIDADLCNQMRVYLNFCQLHQQYVYISST